MENPSMPGPRCSGSSRTWSEGRYDAVLCMDLDRLSRGRMKDQGSILDTFRESDTLIITPEKGL